MKKIINNKQNIKLMLFGESDGNNILFYLLGINTLNALSDLPKTFKFKELNFIASKNQDEYIYPDDVSKKQTINDLINYFKKSEYIIDDLEAVLDNNIKIFAHDDYEMSITCSNKDSYKALICKILKNHKFNPEIIYQYLIDSKNQYIQVETPDKIINSFATFEEYLMINRD